MFTQARHNNDSTYFTFCPQNLIFTSVPLQEENWDNSIFEISYPQIKHRLSVLQGNFIPLIQR